MRNNFQYKGFSIPYVIIAIAGIVILLSYIFSCHNSPPQITSEPVITAVEGSLYNYEVEATDPNDDTLTYALTQKPEGMEIDSSTGLIKWTPTREQVGNHEIILIVDDHKCRDHADSQSLIITVSEKVGPCQNECDQVELKKCANENSYQICGNYDADSCLEWGSIINCPSNTICQNGSCIQRVEPCQDECAQTGIRRCSNDDYQICGNYDTDSCLEWSSVINCPQNTTCQNGICEKQVVTYLVTRVIDGDTIEIEGGQGVRYIGIDTPETVHPSKPVECFGLEASNKNKELVEGKEVRLEKDVSETDTWGRLLRYVYVDDIFVNDYLVKQGYAYASTVPPDVKYAEQFVRAQREAKEYNRGLWARCEINREIKEKIEECNKESFEPFKLDCFIELAFSENNVDICNYLPDEPYFGIAMCYLGFAALKEDPAVCLKLEGEFYGKDKSTLCIQSYAFEEKDSSICDFINNPGDRADCYASVTSGL